MSRSVGRSAVPSLYELQINLNGATTQVPIRPSDDPQVCVPVALRRWLCP